MKKIIFVSFLFLAALTVIPAAARDLKSPEPDSQKQEKKIPPRLVSVDFDKAQLSELVLMVSEFTGAAFVFDDDIENPVTWSQRNIPKDELIPTFIDVLTALDYTVSRIEGFNDFWSIKSDPTLSAGALSVSSGIYQLKNLSADAVMDSAEILYGEKMAVYGYEDNQVVSFSGSPKLVTEFITLLQRIDIPALRDESGVLSLTVKHISVKRAVQALADLQIFKGSASKKTSGSSKKKGTSKSTTKSVGTSSTFPVFPDYWHSAILVFGTHKQQDIVRTVLAALDKPEQGQNDAVVFLHTVTADQVLPILEESFGDLRIHAYSENRLHLSGESSLVLAAVTMARRLDGTGQQVKVEAVVAYLTDSQFRELGTRFAFTRSDLSGSINDGLSSMVLSSNPGMLLNFFDGIINVDLTAKDSTGKGKIISSPVLTVLNDHEAQIMIGRNVPFISKSKQDNEDGEGEGEEKNTISVDRHDVGLSFTVQPSIQPGGDFIALTVAQELSNVAEDSQLDAAVDLVVDKKSLSSTVLVGDGDTILLGGLRSDETATSIEQVPFLGELPLLGPLFSYESEKTESLHLVVSLRVQTVSAPYALNKRALL
jgi:general secretion pathway protein D